MSIYTKTGDKGETSLFGGVRVSKSSPQVEAYGLVDELTSFIGLVVLKIKEKKTKRFLTKIQQNLYQIMGFLSGTPTELKNLKNGIAEFEKKIDEMDKKLPKLNRFILPQGTEISSWFHIIRTSCRKAERNIVAFFNSQSEIRNKQLLIIRYINRLSDLFFMFARWYNKDQEIKT